MAEITLDPTFPRGSEWRQWDLHIHTPASFHWDGERFDIDPESPRNVILIDQMIDAMNMAEPAVFCVMDYWTFDGWFALKRRLLQEGAPKLHKKVFPGIELRLVAPADCRLNAHVLFSDEIDDQDLVDFKSRLEVEIIKKPLSDDALIKLARNRPESFLKAKSFDYALVQTDETYALKVGSSIAEINCETYKSAVARVPNGQAIGFMPYDTSDGLEEIDWKDHYAYFIGLFDSSPIFETRNADKRGAFVNEETPGNVKWIKHFQEALSNIPRLAVSGSDAHRFVGTKGNNDRRGYGDFPSGKITWIKADPTFRGLQQAIKEPAKRSFIGACPPKILEVAQNKTYFLDAISVKKAVTGSKVGEWLADTHIQLNPDLIAIIGNKGSGKSALADIIALLGNSKQKKHFAFLKENRFRGRSGEPAKHFIGNVLWKSGSSEERNLNDDASVDKVELVRYIPQGHFEELCNDHITGKSNAFEQELRSVIFSHTDETIRLGALDFDQLLLQQEGIFRDRLTEARSSLSKLNQEISTMEDQLQPQVLNELKEKLILKKSQLDEHEKIKPTDPSKPSEQLTPEQTTASQKIEELTEKLALCVTQEQQYKSREVSLSAKLRGIQNLREKLRIVERSFQQVQRDSAEDLKLIELDLSSLIQFEINTDLLDQAEKKVAEDYKVLNSLVTELSGVRRAIASEMPELQAKLNGPQLEYQQALTAVLGWTAKRDDIVGSQDTPESLKGVEERIRQINELPARLEKLVDQRMKLTAEIFEILNSQREARESLFKPVHDLIGTNKLIRDDYKIQFEATLGCSSEVIATTLFTFVKQTSGDFRGEDESFSTVRRVAEKYDLNVEEDILDFVNEIHSMLVAANKMGEGRGISQLLRKDRKATEVYDFIFGLSFLEPRYTLLFQDTRIEQLSPGQRGALLLIFYLLVDKGTNPIILDQPEENLDNETLVNLLVPVLTEAKKKRQIVMVTHNPNLAVVCDAEQVIYSSFDRKAGHKISYTTGSIEKPDINLHVVTVLEGTKPAFNNRRIKYH